MLPGTIFIVAKKCAPVGLEGTCRKVGGKEINPRIPVHEGVLYKYTFVIHRRNPADHRLWHPIGIGELFQGIKVCVFHHRDGIHVHLLIALIRDPYQTQLYVFAQRNKNQNLTTQPIEFTDIPGITQSNVGFKKVVSIQCRHKKRRKELFPFISLNA